jgi:sugar/nucleoside kinase (ribokinase family)
VQVMKSLPNVRTLLVTGGGEGCAFCSRNDSNGVFSGSVPVYKVDVQDTTGAGDAFTCGLMAYLLAEVQCSCTSNLSPAGARSPAYCVTIWSADASAFKACRCASVLDPAARRRL